VTFAAIAELGDIIKVWPSGAARATATDVVHYVLFDRGAGNEDALYSAEETAMNSDGR
jgi:hypothetical protein